MAIVERYISRTQVSSAEGNFTGCVPTEHLDALAEVFDDLQVGLTLHERIHTIEPDPEPSPATPLWFVAYGLGVTVRNVRRSFRSLLALLASQR